MAGRAVKVEVLGLIMDEPAADEVRPHAARGDERDAAWSLLPGKTINRPRPEGELSLTSFTDDKGTDLSKAKDQGMVFRFGKRRQLTPEGREGTRWAFLASSK